MAVKFNKYLISMECDKTYYLCYSSLLLCFLIIFYTNYIYIYYSAYYLLKNENLVR